MTKLRPFDPTKVPPPPHGYGWPVHAHNFREVDLEIGAGAGLHAIRYAQAHPERFLIAIEKTTKFFRLEKRVSSHQGIENLWAVRADAIRWITHFVSAHSLSRIFLLYPNPYPKARHRNLRWHAMPFMGFLLSRLKKEGELILATNEEFYAKEAEQLIVQTWGMDLRSKRKIRAEETARTHFEKKYLRRGDACFNLIFQKSQFNVLN